MKKFVLMAFIALFFAFNGYAQKGSISISIKIASLKRDCDGGIGFRCGGDVTVSHEFKISANSHPREVVMNMSSGLPNTITLKMKKFDQISQTLYSEVFKDKTVFTLDEDWAIPADYLTKINYAGEFTVRAGTYQVSEDAEFITVTLTK